MGANRTMATRRGGHHGDAGAAHPIDDAGTVTVHVPLAFHQHRGRKVLVAPEGTVPVPLSTAHSPRRAQRAVTPAVRALARAFRWRKLLETGAVVTVNEIAAAERINPSYVSRVLRLTLLAPERVEALMVGATDVGAPLDQLMLPFSVEWDASINEPRTNI